ncbi:toll/interleukin-1 receptor domain-containing protein [Synechococcus sp. PCC 7336]|uniref:toll/interleukin-1 receptor domain-containing protein n=1 Tax=Synechococcus sp. PCC 7336 TaxID=195250 RepID=UPI0003494537|nr:toll/interleukin-1 receptor domain-containing protein [Synechococcus sp. PCC 7336]
MSGLADRPFGKVFISYAREDECWAKERTRVLRGVGATVFFDRDSILAGSAWPEQLRREVEGADLVWLMWSKSAAQSDWVRQEYTAALAAVLGERIGDREQLLDFAIAREKQYWQRKARDLGLPEEEDEALSGGATAVVLAGGSTAARYHSNALRYHCTAARYDSSAATIH